MKPPLDKLKSIAKEISDDRVELALFALFLREDSENKWDLVVAAPWINTDSIDDINYIAGKLKIYLDDSELLSISRIVLVDLHDPIVQIINNHCSVKPGGSLELYDLFSIGLPFFKHAYILISQSGKPVLVNVGEQNLRQSI